MIGRSGLALPRTILGAIAALCLLAGGALLAIDAGKRDDDGYFSASLVSVSSTGYAVTSDKLDLGDDDAVEDVLDRVRVRASSDTGTPLFVGVARQRDLRAYLAGVARTRVSDVRDDHTPVTHDVSGGPLRTSPRTQPFWQATASGAGAQTVEWKPRSGDWAVAVLNADGSPHVDADVRVAVKTNVLRWIGFGLLGGFVLAGGGVVALFAGRRKS
ncbi:MAG TPA: hypothetical protein VFZ89_18545 [Solirubrobacteraceae bacterium]